MNEILRKIPSVDEVLKRPPVQALISAFSRPLVLKHLQAALHNARESVRSGLFSSESELNAVLDDLPAILERSMTREIGPSLSAVINATGVILHTNIGRAPLPRPMFETISRIACAYSNLEFDVTQGARGHRDKHIETRLMRLLGCEAATVANNNAAALLLILNTLALGRKVIISRGELVEIGGSFRIPEILETSGAILKEVGTTNKTRVDDYRRAIDDQVAMILRVHPSNYKMVGFTERPKLEELVQVARDHGIPLVEDSGSGYLFPTPLPFFREEPSVLESLEAQADLVCFSGDKIFGGPQAGMILGRRELVERIRRNPLMRACRVDKITYAALEWVLTQYETGRHTETLPVYRMMAATRQEIRRRAEPFAERLAALGFSCRIADGYSLVGGGAAPGETIDTTLVLITSRGYSANTIEEFLRRWDPPILSRIETDELAIDLRTVLPDDEPCLLEALAALSTSPSPAQ